MPHPSISVIVPTYNRPDRVRACVRALAAQTLPRASFEIVVVDDGSDGERPSTVDWGIDAPVRVIRQDNAGPSVARNRGVAESRGDILAFTDDDCCPEPGWLAALVAALEAEPDALVGGSTTNGLAGDTCAEASQLIVRMVYDHFNDTDGRAYFLASNNIACRRERYHAVGGFSTDFVVPGAEDRDFCDRWRVSGAPIAWVRDARVVHYHAQNLRSFTRLHYRYGRGAYPTRQPGAPAVPARWNRTSGFTGRWSGP